MARPFRVTAKSAAIYCYVWLMVGFFSGTVLLVGPVRWITANFEQRGLSQQAQNFAMIGVIGVYIIASALVALWLVRHMSRCRTWHLRFGIPTVLTLAAGLCLWGWLNPARLAGMAGGTGGSVDVGHGAEFVFGPYPESDRLAQLKKDGFTAVISLQHPTVLPFEPVDIQRETQAANQIGLTFIPAPMLPWIASNDAALEKILEIARTGHGRYYVHCGLGRDRANVVKRMLEIEGARVASEKGMVAPQTLASGINQDGDLFERGRVQQLDADMWMIPYPNKQEIFEKMLSGQIKHVTLVLDPSDPDQERWLGEAQRLLPQFKVSFDFHSFDGKDPHTAHDIIAAALTAPRPEAVVVPYTDPYPSSQIQHALLEAYHDKH